MQESLTERLAPKLKRLNEGGYARSYRKGSKTYRSGLHLAVAEMLDAIGDRYKENVKVSGMPLAADFLVKGTYLFVDRQVDSKSLAELRRGGRRIVFISRGTEKSDAFDAGLRVVTLGGEEPGNPQTIFLDDPSFNFDYAHILPKTQKCSVMHGHTSSALVEIVGSPIEGMVVDFGVAKEVVRDAIRDLDHKLFINKKYVSREGGGSVTLRFMTVHGYFTIKAPKKTTVLLEGEATVENLAREVLSRIAPRMPENVSAVGVYVYEGLNKGTHLLAQVHSREVRKLRSGP
jgi:6-pyruvoyltetrahydropterin/6-carboxytetrahydropterin synthase